MNEYRAPMDYTAMGREYLAQADVLGEKAAQLRREYRRARDRMVKGQMENWKGIEADLRRQGLELIRRGERRNNQMEVF